jgi:hypothetical protein
VRPIPAHMQREAVRNRHEDACESPGQDGSLRRTLKFCSRPVARFAKITGDPAVSRPSLHTCDAAARRHAAHALSNIHKRQPRCCGSHDWATQLWTTSRVHGLVLWLNRRFGPLSGCRSFNAVKIWGQG